MSRHSKSCCESGPIRPAKRRRFEGVTAAAPVQSPGRGMRRRLFVRTFFSRYPLWQTSQPSGTSEAPCGFILWICNAKPDQPVFLPSPPATPNQKGFQPLAATEAQARWYSMMENLRRKRESSSWHPPWRWMSPAQILSTLCHSFRCLDPSRFFFNREDGFLSKKNVQR